ncbi:MAG: metallophosphoesterase family protein [Clostridia bacterium]|nr:metallophosphoesterase family protein [Clostridia bacterium]
MITRAQWKTFRGSKEYPDQVMLSIKGDPSRSMTVRWRTDAAVKEGFALYREKGSTGPWMRADAVCRHFETDLDDSNYFFADMSGLSPDTVYEYTVGSGEYRSKVFSFKSARENVEEFSFLCLADVQTGGPEPPADYTVFGEVLKKILACHPECEFILTAGDNTNCGQTDIQWTGLFNGLAGISERIPVMFAMGNHDDMGFENYFEFTGKYYSEYAEYFTNMLCGSYNENGPAMRNTANYAFDYGNAHFNVLGTSGYEEMNDWLKADASASKKTWKFAVHHFPVCYSGPTIENEDTWPSLKEGMDECDVVFSGHEHSFARSYPRRGDGLFDRPSEGTVHYNLGSGNRNPPGTRVVPKVWNAKTYEHEEDLSMFSVVTVNGNKCTLRAYVEDGRLVDECVIDKENDIIYPIDRAPVYNRPRLKFKGYDLGMCCEHTLPKYIDGLWYICPGAVMSYTGGTAKRAPGRIRVEIYGRFAEFAEGSRVMLTRDGEQQMAGPCLRLDREQLFVPVEDFCRPLRMHPLYFTRNNFISIESETEERPVEEQP